MAILETDSLQLILHSGNARSLAYEALTLVKTKDLKKGNDKMSEARAELLIAQKQHAQLLRRMANDEQVMVDLLLVHAEGHISSSQVAVELSDEMIQLYERIGELK